MPETHMLTICETLEIIIRYAMEMTSKLETKR